MMGGAVLGIVGAIIAIPVAAIVQVAFDEAFVARRERRQDVDRAGTLVSGM
jgi:predicted PurR-regulated permease PerM